ncbi:hypothetical protein EW146_g1698 [Bondarzewia mesenterica]|uniref:3-hydroxyisobutyryl-CoA hydrolase n=1 Tax=Bondarzewia mesenterica TaxID=1095465 RepID=A0A4S4M328_9AGAM|nr:hypothetical protein EW146_g1698 [Bondarzewia mesenterica]
MPLRSLSSTAAARRTGAIARHMASSTPSPTSPQPDEAPVMFEENLASRRFILNRPKKLNALNTEMIDSIASKTEAWGHSNLCGVIVGSSVGKAFCAGGDVAGIVELAAKEDTRAQAIDFFSREFGLDYALATLSKPYVAIMDGITYGGGVGLAAPALFRIATERTGFSMPETKIGYFPDVGASYYLSRLDGEIGTYLALTGAALSGRATFEHGFATHFISSHRVPILLERLAAIENPTLIQIDNAIEELHYERESSDPVAPLTGAIRIALDKAFQQDTVEGIFKKLREYADGKADPVNADVVQWAKDTLAMMEDRSPTSLKVALMAIRKGKKMSLLDALKMELGLASAYCSGVTPDFSTGVRAVLIDKIKTRPAWSPSDLTAVSISTLESQLFQPSAANLHLPERLQAEHDSPSHFLRFALPSEEEIGKAVIGDHKSSGGSALTLDELVTKFEKLRRGKHGVAEKVNEVVKRRCTFQDKEGKYLRWKH